LVSEWSQDPLGVTMVTALESSGSILDGTGLSVSQNRAGQDCGKQQRTKHGDFIFKLAI
jgi:hypothetical protein